MLITKQTILGSLCLFLIPLNGKIGDSRKRITKKKFSVGRKVFGLNYNNMKVFPKVFHLQVGSGNALTRAVQSCLHRTNDCRLFRVIYFSRVLCLFDELNGICCFMKKKTSFSLAKWKQNRRRSSVNVRRSLLKVAKEEKQNKKREYRWHGNNGN